MASFSVVFLSFSALAAERERVVITTLDWPPYTGSELPKSGATTEVVRQAFDQAGLGVDVQFLPWKRAIAEAKNGDAVAYYPGYHCKHAADFEPSNSVGTGPLGFAEHVEAPISWETVYDLGEQKLKIGTVLGYANTDEFDEKVGTGWIRAISAQDDLTNLKKLLRRRIDAVVIDKLVMSYLVATEPSQGAISCSSMERRSRTRPCMSVLRKMRWRCATASMRDWRRSILRKSSKTISPTSSDAKAAGFGR